MPLTQKDESQQGRTLLSLGFLVVYKIVLDKALYLVPACADRSPLLIQLLLAAETQSRN